jgi:hemin uptake protein HemP
MRIPASSFVHPVGASVQVQPERPPGTAHQTPGIAEIDSARLLQGGRELLIRHGREHYRLRHTRNDKLILTK